MLENLQMMQMAQDAARHAGKRQALSAMNVANADTPGYRARDVREFAATYRTNAAAGLRTTRPGHVMASPSSDPDFGVITADGQVNPNGNSVSLEEEMVRSVSAERQHQRAVTVYQHGLTVLKTAIGSRR